MKINIAGAVLGTLALGVKGQTAEKMQFPSKENLADCLSNHRLTRIMSSPEYPKFIDTIASTFADRKFMDTEPSRFWDERSLSQKLKTDVRLQVLGVINNAEWASEDDAKWDSDTERFYSARLIASLPDCAIKEKR